MNKVPFVFLSLCFLLSIVNLKAQPPVFMQEALNIPEARREFLDSLSAFMYSQEFLQGVSTYVESNSQLDLEELFLISFKKSVELAVTEIRPVLTKREQKIFDRTELVIDKDTVNYFPLRPVFINKQKNPQLVFTSKWFIGFQDRLLAKMISADTSLNRRALSEVYQYLMPIVPFSINQPLTIAALSEDKTIEFDDIATYVFMGGVMQKVIQFTYLHELSHIIDTHFDEIQADSFALNKLFAMNNLEDSDIQELYDYVDEHGSNSLIDIMLPFAEDPGLADCSTIFFPIAVIQFMEEQLFLSPQQSKDSSIKIFEQLQTRLSHFYLEAMKQGGCNSGKSPIINGVSICDELRAKYIKGFDRKWHKEMQTMQQELLIRIPIDSINVESTRYVCNELKRVNPDNPQGAALIYGIKLASYNYFQSSVDYTDEAIMLLHIGSVCSIEANSYRYTAEMSKLLCGALYEYKKKDYRSAISAYYSASSYKYLFPSDFYMNKIKELREQNE